MPAAEIIYAKVNRMITNHNISQVLAKVRRANRQWPVPVVGHYTETPFTVLISCILSLRTQDKTTYAASERLFRLATTPAAMAKLPLPTIRKAIYPVCFYNNKARAIQKICAILLTQYQGQVPKTIEELVELPGVGRKTANLTMTLGHRLSGICVDTHVHRISNRWGYIKTKLPDESEMALRKKLPARHWMEYNDLLVTYGQNLCKPISPHCTQCPFTQECPKHGVTTHR